MLVNQFFSAELQASRQIDQFPIGSFFFRCLTGRVFLSGRRSRFGGRIDLPDVNDPATPPAAASDGL